MAFFVQFNLGWMKTIFSFFIRLCSFNLYSSGCRINIRCSQADASHAPKHAKPIYGLEREIAHHHTSQAITTLTLVGIPGGS